MGFDRYLKTKEILKRIDPGQGSAPSSSNPQLPQEVLDERENQATPIKTLVGDLIIESQAVQQQVKTVINDIFEYNKSDSGFVEYVEMVQANHFNPATLISNPSSKPVEVYSENQVKAAERNVYRRVVDPRAPFVGDLHNLLSDAGLSEYTLRTVWDRIAEPNGLYSDFNDENRLVRYALYREREHITHIRYSADRIKRNQGQRLSYEFMKAMSDKVVGQINIAEPKEQIAQVNKLISLIKQVKTLLIISSIFNGESWDKFQANIKDIYGDFMSIAANRAIRAQSYSIIGGVQDLVMDFTEGIENIIPLNVNLDSIPEMREMRNQLDNVLARNLEKVEDDLTSRDAISAKLEESRQLMILNSKKNLRTKQFIETLNSILAFLEQIKSQLINISYFTQIDVDNLTTSLTNNADAWIRKISVKNSRSVKVETPPFH